MRHVLSWLALFWLWMLLAGEWNRQQWIAAAAAATIASSPPEERCSRTSTAARTRNAGTVVPAAA